jgi:hypothetical protein
MDCGTGLCQHAAEGRFARLPGDAVASAEGMNKAGSARRFCDLLWMTGLRRRFAR